MAVTTFLLDGWAAAADTWARCTFPRTRAFDYLEQLAGEPERAFDAADRVILVGFSMGSSTALRLVLRDPGKIAGLVLVSGTARMMEDKASGWIGMSPHRRAALLYGTQLVNKGSTSPLFAEENLVRGLDYLQETDLRAALQSLDPTTFPVSLLQGGKDGIVRPANADFLKRVFPQAELTFIPEGMHDLPISHPELVDNAVSRVRFLVY